MDDAVKQEDLLAEAQTAASGSAPRRSSRRRQQIALDSIQSTSPQTANFGRNLQAPTSTASISHPAIAAVNPQSACASSSTYDEAAARALMFQPLAPLSLAPRALAPQSGGLGYHQRIHLYFASLKDCLVYQLSPRPHVSASSPSWKDVIAHRSEQQHLHGFVKQDALRESRPLKLLKLERQAVEDANLNASPATLDAVANGRVFGLPSAASFAQAPILGVDDTNVIVRSSAGETLLQRFAPTSLHQAARFRGDWSTGQPLLDALFDRTPQAQVCNGAESLRCGGWVESDGQVAGWTEEHAERRPEADNALRWLKRYFHDHITTFACYLEKDFREDLLGRQQGFSSYRHLMGEDQTRLAHSWWALASIARGYSEIEHSSPSYREPTIHFGFGEPFLLYIAPSEGFVKLVVRPGQVVFFRSHQLHSIYPLKASSQGVSRYGVTLCMPRSIAGLKDGAEHRLRQLTSPPQPAPGDREPRISFAGVGRGRVGRSRGA